MSLQFYQSLGLHVLRLWGILPNGACQCGRPSCAPRSAGKHPIRPNWQKTPPDSALGAGENVGLKMGLQPSGQAVVALDVDSPELFAALKSRLGPLPPTLRTNTGRGFHLLFQVPPALLPLCRNFVKRDGVDLRAEGGQVVAAPSLHYSGRPYVLAAALAPAWLPVEWFQWLAQSSAPRVSEGAQGEPCPLPRDDRWLPLARSLVAEAPADYRGSSGLTWKMAVRLVRGLCLPLESALALLEQFNAASDEPLPREKLERACREAERSSELPWGFARPPRSPGSLNAANSPEELLPQLPPALVTAEPKPEPAEFAPRQKRQRDLTQTELTELGCRRGAKSAVHKLAIGDAYSDVANFGEAMKILAYAQPDGWEWSAKSVEALLQKCWTGGQFDIAEAWANIQKTLKEGSLTLLGLQKIFWSHAAWQGCLAFDELASRPVWLKPPPITRAVGVNVSEADAVGVRVWCEKEFGDDPGKDKTWDALSSFAKSYATFNPLQDRLNALVWDGAPRLDSWLVRAAGAAPKQFTSEIGAKWMIAAVARAFKPGCKVDNVLVLQGERGGEGKSSVFELMALEDPWYLAMSSDLGGVASKEILRGKWIVSLDELAALSRSELNATYQFLTLKLDDYRAAYGRGSEQYPRRCVFGATVNKVDFIANGRNERRWWPVSVKTIDQVWLLANRDQLWAEAKARFEAGADWWKVDWTLQIDAQDEFVETDALADVVEGWLLRCPSDQRKPFTLADCMAGCGLRPDDTGGAKRISAILRRLNHAPRVISSDGRSVRRWAPV